MRKPSPPVSPKRVRTNVIGDIYPLWQSGLLQFYNRQCLDSIRFEVPAIPKSLNHMYVRTKNGMFLHPDIRKFRQTVDLTLRDRIKFFPTGLIAAIIEFQSPDWITKARTVRKMDIDNKIKPVLDAIEHCTGIRDELYWHVHAIKVVSKERKTVVHLFDIGDIVDVVS